MESLLKNLKEHVKCSICLNTFTEPKTIACLHTFCCGCLKRQALTTQQQGQFRCPVCQAQVEVPESFDQLPTGFLQESLLGLLAVQKSGDGSGINCGNCKKESTETSFCFNCGKFLCTDCANAHELLRNNVAFVGHKVKPIKHFQTDDYEALLKRQAFCSQQHLEREMTKYFCVDCETCICQVCVYPDHKDHAVDPLGEAADREKAKFISGTELMKEKSNISNNIMRDIEETTLNLEENISKAKREVSQAAEQMIIKIREGERDAIATLESTRLSRTEKLNAVKAQLNSLTKQINQAIEFAENLVQRGSGANILRSKKLLEKRLEDLRETPVPTLPISSFVKFVSTFEPHKLILGFMATSKAKVVGLERELQAGVKAEFIVCPNLTSEVQGEFRLDVCIEPAENVGSLVSSEKEDGNYQVTFTPKMPGNYSIRVTASNLSLKSIFTGHIQVNERRFEIVGELDLKRERIKNPRGIAVNSKGLTAVTDCNGHCILLFDKEGNYLRKFGCKGTNVGQFDVPSYLTFVSENEILVADQFNNRIQQFNIHTGKAIRVFGKEGAGEGELLHPLGVSVDCDGRVVVANCSNNKIQVFTKEGEPVFSFGASGPGTLNCPTACIFHQNTFIVSDTQNHCLKLFDSSGNFLRKIGEQGKGDGQLHWPKGLCVEKSGNHYNILVCDRDNQRIVQFTMDGLYTGKSVAKLRSPVGVATTANGRILVSDFSVKKIYVLR